MNLTDSRLLQRGPLLGMMVALAIGPGCADDVPGVTSGDESSTGDDPTGGMTMSTSTTMTPTASASGTMTTTPTVTDTDTESETTPMTDTEDPTTDTDTTGPGITCGDGVAEGDEECDGDDLAGEDCESQEFDEGTLGCSDECTFDTDACVLYSCDNDMVEGKEVCDGTDLPSDCAGEGFDGGEIACNDDCLSYDTSACFVCGDDMIGGAEICDGTDLDGQDCVLQGFDEGTLGCAATCDAFDTSGCATCGDGTLNGTEECEGTDFGGMTCADFGFVAGALACDVDNCTIDSSACTNTICAGDTPVALPAGAPTASTITVPGVGAFVDDIDITVDVTTAWAGSLTVELRHVESDTAYALMEFPCDSEDNLSATFDDEAAGGLTCGVSPLGSDAAAAPSGPGTVLEGLADTAGTYELTVTNPFFDGTLDDWCLDFETTDVDPAVCDGVALQFGELCDGTLFNGDTCFSEGFINGPGGDAGELGCAATCDAFDYTNCNGPQCGDDAIGAPEVCDGTDLAGETCVGLGFDGGELACAADCSGYDTSACYTCGDDIAFNPPEDCDGLAVDGMTCEDLGFVGGPLNCNVDCTFDDTECSDTVITICSTPGFVFGAGAETVVDTVTLADAGQVGDIDVFVDNSPANWSSDFQIDLRHVDTDTSMNVWGTDDCLEGADMFATFNDEGTSAPDCVEPVAVEGNIFPTAALSLFDGLDIASDWELTMTDEITGDDPDGTLNEWCLYITVAP